MNVRETTADDAEAVQRVARASWHAAYDEILGEGTVTDKVDSWFNLENVTADVNREERPFFVATTEGRVVGFAIGAPDDDRDATYHLYRIYVQPNDWGRGVGTKLLERLEAELQSRGVERLRLSVFQENEDAIGFYESSGFERVEEGGAGNFDLPRLTYAKDLG
ncbi:GNAT family N-acetyltransferase [Halorussus halophilus]|uniref:GNAT family N-acetyltransferase n=1 Tax=Halorussus halophilus TaxID=2650975 RepID=UPI00130128DF|nr:GNAT family N-acetyltransferase [Halorussus halophilus]